MARTVADAAILLGVLEGADARSERSGDERLHASAEARLHAVPRRDGLKGARIGIPRAFYYDPATTPGERAPRGGLNEAQKRVMAEPIAVLTAQGATSSIPRTFRAIVTTDPAQNLLQWGAVQRT